MAGGGSGVALNLSFGCHPSSRGTRETAPQLLEKFPSSNWGTWNRSSCSSTALPGRVLDHPPACPSPPTTGTRRDGAESSRPAGNDRKVIAKQGGWVPNSGVMEGYFEDTDRWEENAMIGVL
ncbi:hypothetical protein DY245_14890 [Streptomyces inhibens]|uniref:Uncharacterized protein n=1 Tax=Streptomyces inhibens TaxID=2293571 RepID=A0A371Q4K4_STRIH|nr:hypothetical protein DY245_14890 [Streptomyces inhibens]